MLDKVAALSGAAHSQLEDPQVARYERGQSYEPHCDGPELSDPQARARQRDGRVGTRTDVA